MTDHTADLMKLLTWWQRRKVAKRPVITSCDLTYSGFVAHQAGTCRAHGTQRPNSGGP